MAVSFGPYSVFRNANGFMFVSGQIGVALDGTTPSDITNQTKNALQNLRNILHSENLDMDDVVKTTVFLTNMDNFKAMNEEYIIHFDKNKPARSAVAVKELPRVGGEVPILIEIEAIAMKGSK